MKTSQLFGFAFLMAILWSCQKDANVPTTRPTSFKELTASQSFNWETHQLVTVEIKATQVPATIKRTLTITTDKGDVIYKGLYQMSTKFLSELTIPREVKELTISYGSIQKTEVIGSGSCKFDMVLPAEAYGSF